MIEKDWIEKALWPTREWNYETRAYDEPPNLPKVGDLVLVCHKAYNSDLEVYAVEKITGETKTRFRVGEKKWEFEKSGGAYGSKDGMKYGSFLRLYFEGWESALENFNTNQKLRRRIEALAANCETAALESAVEILKGNESDG